jgi:hypothetical protein
MILSLGVPHTLYLNDYTRLGKEKVSDQAAKSGPTTQLAGLKCEVYIWNKAPVSERFVKDAFL